MRPTYASAESLHGHPPHLNQHFPHLPAYNVILPPRNDQKQETAIPDEQLVKGANADEKHVCIEKHVDAPSTVQDGFVYVINVDPEEFNNRVGDLLQHAERNITCRSTPLLLVNKEDDECVHFESRATMKLIFILTLLSTALRVLLQTNLPTPVTCSLLIVVVFAFSYLLLLAPLCYKKYVCVMYIAHVCFGITTFAMALAIALQTWGFAESPSIGS